MALRLLLLVIVLPLDLANAQAFSSLNNVTLGNLTVEKELHFPSKSNMTLEDFHSVLFSDAPYHFGSRHLRASESNELWLAAVQYEWERALEIESSATTGLRSRGLQEESVTFPYMACVMEHTTGENCHNQIQELFGEDMLPVYNGADKTCYIIRTSPTRASSSAAAAIQITPLLPESKIREGCMDQIETSPNLPAALHMILSPGAASSEEEVNSIASDIMQSLNSEGRRLVSKHFLREEHSSPSRHEERQRFWKRQLSEGLESGMCGSMFDAVQIEVADKNDAFTLSLPTASNEYQLRECLHSLVAGLATRQEICSVEIRGEMKLLNAEAQWITQSGVRDSLPFFGAGLDGSGEIVTVSDTGVDDDNCYFWDSSGSPVIKDGRVDMTRRKIVQYVGYANTGDSTRGHGTHVAGSAVGRRAVQGTAESTGIADGMARGAKLSVFDIGFGGSSLNIPNSPVTLFGFGYNAGSRIHSASWGGPFNTYGFSERVYDDYMRDNDDFLLIIAAGNDGDGNRANTVGAPATCKNGVAVGATQNASPHLTNGMLGQDYLASFSSRGPTRDGRTKPDVLAPGFYVRSAEARAAQTGECDDTNPDGLFFNAGTSMAAPIVSGTAALIRQYFRQGFYPQGFSGSGATMNPSGALVKAVLIGSGQALAGIQNNNLSVSSTSPYDDNQNFGRVTLAAALPLSGQNTISAEVRDRQSISNGQTDTVSVIINTAGCNQPLTATLVWTDPPGFSGCSQCVLNDLDLFVDGPGGRRYANGRSSPDTTNNAERIRINNANNGETYTITVRATDLESSSQDYALVVSGCFGSGGSNPVNPEPENPEPENPEPVNPEPVNPEPNPEAPSTCADGPGTFFVTGSIGFRDCEWLRGQNNQNLYSILCGLTSVASECRQTCGVCDDFVGGGGGNLGQLGEARPFGVLPNGNIIWDGNMFDVVAKRNLVISGMYLHLRDYFGTRTVQVWTKSGTYVGSEFNQGDWQLIANVGLASRGTGLLTTLPPEEFETQTMVPGERRAFYINVVGGSQYLVMDEGTSVGAVHVQNDDLTIYQGNAITSGFGGELGQQFAPYEIDGGVRYAVYEGAGTAARAGCADREGEVDMGDRFGVRDCDWLADNMQRFSFLCEFLDIATACPLTCDICQVLSSQPSN